MYPCSFTSFVHLSHFTSLSSPDLFTFITHSLHASHFTLFARSPGIASTTWIPFASKTASSSSGVAAISAAPRPTAVASATRKPAVTPSDPQRATASSHTAGSTCGQTLIRPACLRTCCEKQTISQNRIWRYLNLFFHIVVFVCVHEELLASKLKVRKFEMLD